MIKYKLHIIYLVMLLTFGNPNTFASEDIRLITKITEFVAGNTITLQFTTPGNLSPFLYVSNSFGSTLIKPNLSSTILTYNIPLHISSRVGSINWRLLNKTHQLQGQLKIIPQNTVKTIQTYLGPPSIAAGGSDYSMLVAIPTDSYDNPLSDDTKIAVKHQFKTRVSTDTVVVKNSIAYKNIYSTEKTGRILINSSCYGLESKEYGINIMPAPPENFTIDYNRHHVYADGNQITTLSTSILKDKYENLVSDGTYVEFFIKTSTATVLKTSGTTINGIATGRIIHPDHADKWTVQAFIDGMAESNSITIDYKSVISDFNIKLSNNNRNITVGPLQSFMNQMIPDGLDVTLYVYSENKLVLTKRKNSADGYVNFKLNINQFPKGTYNITVKAAGNSKSINAIKL
ncbi:hypothetical protein [Algibacter aquimarinus]|uniref:Por secretion system C-terminal sorting domain-containing protein n=1 Tax=Algibacter aquimarinus TaxID=1136748 RepID=A0ABP9HGN4_9FLAO